MTNKNSPIQQRTAVNFFEYISKQICSILKLLLEWIQWKLWERIAEPEKLIGLQNPKSY